MSSGILLALTMKLVNGPLCTYSRVSATSDISRASDRDTLILRLNFDENSSSKRSLVCVNVYGKLKMTNLYSELSTFFSYLGVHAAGGDQCRPASSW